VLSVGVQLARYFGLDGLGSVPISGRSTSLGSAVQADQGGEPVHGEGHKVAGLTPWLRAGSSGEGQGLSRAGRQRDKEDSTDDHADSARHILSQKAATRAAIMAEGGRLIETEPKFFISRRHDQLAGKGF
jgi:hypothetical protein